MDKLKPIITHHFWLVFLVTLGLPPTAWWMTSAALSKETEDRENALNQVINGISSGQGIPNDDWINGVNRQIDIRKEQNRLALDRLWQAQVGMMHWPPNVKQYMEMCPYRGKLEDQRINDILPDLYRNDYQDEVIRVWMLTEPVFDGKMIPKKGVPRKVVFPYDKMPRVPDGKWQLLPPTWPEIWNSQEDLWLLSELFKAVQRVNAPTTGIVDSYVKAIVRVDLFGGKRLGADEVGGSAGGGQEGSPEMAIYNVGSPGGPGFGGAAGVSTEIQTKEALFNLGEEYEAFGLAAVGTQGPDAAASMEYNPMATESGSSGDQSTNDPNEDEKRYVASEEAYRTRGFRLQVAIHQMQVPELIRELLNCQYPVEIVRFQQKAVNPDEPGGTSKTGSGGPGGGYSGTGGAGNVAYNPGEADTGDEGGFDPTAIVGTGVDGPGAGTEEASQVVIQTAMAELDIVDLVIVGELYLYNPPIIDEDGDGVPDETTEGDDSEAAADGTTTPPDPAAVPGATPAAPGTVPAAPGTVPAAPGTVPTAPGTVPATPPNAGTNPNPDAPVIPGNTPPPGTAPAPAAPGIVPGTTPPPGTVPTPASPPGTVPTPAAAPDSAPETPAETTPAPAAPAAEGPATPASPATPPPTNG